MSETAGNTSYNDWRAWAGTLGRQVASVLAMPEAGRITHVTVRIGGYQGAVNAGGGVWSNSNGALRAYSSKRSIPERGQDETLLAWETFSLLNPYRAAAGEELLIGFFRDYVSGSVGMSFAIAGAGTYYRHDVSTELGVARDFVKSSTHSPGTLAAYVTYETGAGVKVRRGGVWVDAAGVKVRRGGVWVDAQLAVRRGGVWTP